MNRENALSAFRITDVRDLLIFFFPFIFFFSSEVGYEFEVDDVYPSHDVLDLLHGCVLEYHLQVFVEFVPAAFEPLSCW